MNKERFKKILYALLFPHIAIVILLFAASAVLLCVAFLAVPDNDIVNYVSYVISAYTLTVICFRIPRTVKWIKEFKETNRIASMLMSDAHLRIKLSLLGSLALNVVYALFQLGLGIYNHSVWFYSFAAYYLLLVLMRYLLLHHTLRFAPGDRMLKELRIQRFCGFVLVLMNIALTVIVGYVTWYSKARVQNQIITIALAAFTFTTMTVAIVNVFKYRQYNSPVWSSSKAIAFVSALVSMLTLEDTMLATFEAENGEEFRQIMALLTGIGVALFVLMLAVFMIHGANKKIKALGKADGSHRELEENI